MLFAKFILILEYKSLLFELDFMTTQELVTELKTITQSNLNIIRKKMGHLSDSQRTWKQNEMTWNINEIFAHLNEYARYYHSTFLKKIEKTKFRTPRTIFISSPLGRSAWQSMKLGNAKNVKRKFASQKSYNTTYEKSLLTGNEIKEFEVRQEELLTLIDKAQTVNLRKVKVPIAISKIIRFRLGDALLFVAYHNQRHVQQALNVLANPKFPKK